ncbi:MAG: DUF4124 domain-containing protein [Burkholderiaceae bacterium]
MASVRSMVATALGGLLFAGSACAQFVWLDDKGVRQYSDMPPPASVPAGRILKAPKGAPRSEEPAPQGTAEPGVAGKDKAPMTLAEKNADFNRRKIEREKQEQKAADEAKQAAERAKNCDRARSYLRALDSGQRIATVGADGERTFVTDQQRQQESAETRRSLADCK